MEWKASRFQRGMYCIGLYQLIVIVISDFLERHSRTKRTTTPAYSRAMRRIKGVFHRVYSMVKSSIRFVRWFRLLCKCKREADYILIIAVTDASMIYRERI